MLDESDDGFMDIDEFIKGCIALRGPSKAVHLEKANLELFRATQAIYDGLAQVESHGHDRDRKVDLVIEKLRAFTIATKHSEQLVSRKLDAVYENVTSNARVVHRPAAPSTTSGQTSLAAVAPPSPMLGDTTPNYGPSDDQYVAGRV